MAVRLKNHITGDSAVNQIKAQLIPESWIINDQTNDYGLDLNVQVCKDNHTTECFFFVQSKGTKDVSHEGEISYAMSVERLKDYKELPLPVLLVLYSKTENVFWGIWANGIYDWLTPEQKRQKKYSVRFHRSNIISSAILEDMGSIIKLDIVGRIDIRTNSAQEYARLHSQIFDLTDAVYPCRFTRFNELAANAICIDYERTDKGIAICVQGHNEKMHIPAGGIEEAFSWYTDVNMHNAPFVLQILVAAIGMVYVDKQVVQIPYRIYTKEIVEELLSIVPAQYWHDWVYYMPIQDLEILTYLHNTSTVCNFKSIMPYILLAMLFRDEPELNVYRERFHRLLLSFETNPEDKGKWCYNLANQIRRENLYEAASLYIQAQKYFPGYKEVYYWWKELAGVLFLTGHYYWSQKFYEKALTLAEDREQKKEIILLISDTFLYRGDIEDAQSQLMDFFDICAEASQTVPCKVLLLSHAYGVYADKLRNDEAINGRGDEWFNEGLRNQEKEQYTKAMECFIIAWAFNVYDYEALKAAMAMAINVQHAMFLTFILGTIREMFEAKEINGLIADVVQWKLPSKSKEGLLRMLRGDDITSMIDA